MKRKTAMRKVFKKGTKLPNEYIYGVDSLLEFSFVVHRSLTHLDLSRCEVSRFKSEEKRKSCKSWFDPLHDTGPDNFIYTEESCRKRLARNRKVLYDYHLDVSRNLEPSLRDVDAHKISHCYSQSVLLSRVIFDREICETYLNRMITEALDQTKHKVKFIHQVSKLAKSMKFISKNKRIRDKSLTLLCFQRADSTVVKDFLSVMDFDIDNLFIFSVHVFEFVLHHAYCSGYDLWEGPSCQDPIHASISYHMFVKTESLFMYRTAPRFCEIIYDVLQDGKRWSLPSDAFRMPDGNGLITRERHLLLLQIVRVFMSEPSKGLKALQMMWRSIPDTYFNLDELTLALSKLPNKEMVGKVCSYIKDITGEEVREESGHTPRKLKHHCRILIRGILDNNRQLSSGINELTLPTSLKSFLRLEK